MIFGENLILREGELGAKGEVFQGVFVENAMDDQPRGGLFKIDAIFARAISVQGAIGSADDTKSVRMFLQKVGGQDIELPQNLHLKGRG